MAQRFQDAVDAWRSGDRSRAEALCKAVVARLPDHADAHRLLIEIYTAGGRVAEAIEACQRVGELAPLDAANWRRLAVFMTQTGRPETAVQLLRRSLELEPDNVRALNNLGSLLNDLGQSQAALPLIERALELKSDYAAAHANRGNALLAANLVMNAVASFDRAIALEPNLAQAHAGRGRALAAGGRGLEAIAAYRRAAELNPRDPRVFMQMGHLMLTLGYGTTALSAFEAVLELSPGDLAAREGCVMTLLASNRFAEAVPAIAALRRDAAWNHYLQGHQLHAQLQCADWSDFTSESRHIAEGIRRGERVDPPMSFIAHNDSPADQHQCARIFMADRRPKHDVVVGRPARGAGARLRVAYLSPDFRDHPVTQLITGVIESHDTAVFDVHGYSTGPDDGSGARRRIAAAFESFHDVSALSDEGVVRHMAETGIDIVVDLGGHTLGSRVHLLAHRPAPVQMTFLGFPGTLGGDFIDYIVADRHVLPESNCAHFSERPIYLPHSYLPGALPPQLDVPVDRSDAGLPPSGVVFCAFHAPYKINPPVFGRWMRILNAVPGSVLWLRDATTVVKSHLTAEAERRGVDPLRLVYAPKVPTLADHFARLAVADLFLDTHPYNAHTTASDALGAGLPVVTVRGESFASRVAASLLETIGLGHLAVTTGEEYERLAVSLATSEQALTDLKRRLRQARKTSPLFDVPRFCRHLESAYIEAWARHARGESPSPLYVAATEVSQNAL